MSLILFHSEQLCRPIKASRSATDEKVDKAGFPGRESLRWIRLTKFHP